MSRGPTLVNDALLGYVRAVGLRDDDVLARLRAETLRLTGDEADMQVSPEQGAFLGLLARAAGVRNAVEVGTFTGYSSICLARALPEGGRLTCVDVSREWTDVARRYWREAGVDGRIDLRIGDGVDVLRGLAAGHAGTVDLVFLDAEKVQMFDYYGPALALLRPGGLLLCDNAFRGGGVADADRLASNPGTQAVDKLNRFMKTDTGIDWCLLPAFDGLGMGVKR